MDTVPNGFVASVMRVILSSPLFGEFNECALLGANYGTIATQFADRALGCIVDIPGICNMNSRSKNGNVTPFFWNVARKTDAGIGPFSPVDIFNFSVVVEDQLFETLENPNKGISLRRFRTMMQSSRFFPCRQLYLCGLYSDTLHRQLDSFFSSPTSASFFTSVTLRCQEVASFKKLFIMIADKKMLKFLDLNMPQAPNKAPMWLQDNLMRIFFQPQFGYMTLTLERDGTCRWIEAFVDSLVVRWMGTPESFPKTSKTIRFPYGASLTSPDLLSKYDFHKVKRPGRLVSRRFDCAHPTDMERRMIARVYANADDCRKFTNTTDNDVQQDSNDYWFCLWAKQVMLTFAHNDGDMALSLANLNCSPRTVKQERYPLIVLYMVLMFALNNEVSLWTGCRKDKRSMYKGKQRKIVELKYDEFNECALLGANYGTIAKETAGRTLGCTIHVPGILGEDPLPESGEVTNAPFLWTYINRTDLEISSFSSVDLFCFTVVADELHLEASKDPKKGLSLQRFRSLMDSCRFAAFRQLLVWSVRYDTLHRQLNSLFSAPGLASFFNAVVIQYQESESFKKLFLMFAKAMKLKVLHLTMPDFVYTVMNDPDWLQDALTWIFYQPQFYCLTFALPVNRSCSWIDKFVDRLVVRWLKTPSQFPRSTKLITYPYQAPSVLRDLLFDCAHPTEVERRLIAKVDSNAKDSNDYRFCMKARWMVLTIANVLRGQWNRNDIL
uniref:Pkinase_fungal domain-containing protein n=1 Tax=Steinernema glaseri TaxID=37863 RepID=A0A1I7ZM43_9BILA